VRGAGKAISPTWSARAAPASKPASKSDCRAGCGVGSYTLQRATFGTDLRLASVVHPDAVDSEIEVPAGSRIPGIPVHSGKAGISWAITSRIMAGAQLVAQSGAFFRGDERICCPRCRALRARSAGALPDRPRVSIIGHLQNALDHDYSTFGALGDASLIGETIHVSESWSAARDLGRG
jgi:hypothetical protein